MVCVLHEPWTIWPLKDEDEAYRHGSRQCTEPSLNSKPDPACSSSHHKVSRQILWVDGQFYTPALLPKTVASTGTQTLQEKRLEKAARSKVPPNRSSAVPFAAQLRACAKNKDLHEATRLHEAILGRGLLEICSDSLVIVYARCGALVVAQELLDMHPSRNVFTWNALMAAYARCGQGQDALKCFDQMQCKGLSPNAITYSTILTACGSMKEAVKGEQIHEKIARQGLLENDVVLGNALVDMYVKCGALSKARQVLEDLPVRDVISWNSLIAGYAQQNQCEQAIDCFKRMDCEGFAPDAVTFTCILKACGSMGAVDMGEEIHENISRQGLLRSNTVLVTALVDMYAKCGVLTKARQVLDELGTRDVASWNALIAGYAQHDQGEQALQCYECMQLEGLYPNAMTFSSILKACGSAGDLGKGEEIHHEVARQGLLEANITVGNAVVGMYSKCGALDQAKRVLENLPVRDAVSWNALIAGYIQEGEGEQALICFEKMQEEGLSPTTATLTCILKACSTMGAVERGEQIHDEIAKQGLLSNNFVLGTALVDMYAKSGALAKAQKVLEELPTKDVVPWNAVITGYAQQGQGEQVLMCFEQMQREGLFPDAVTFSCVLNACSHLGLVEDGYRIFVDMSRKYSIEPSLEHYTCMIDLLGRAGCLDKAVDMIREVAFSDDSAVWSALLDACGKWGDVGVGRWAFEQAVQRDRCDPAAYVLMANLYAAAGMQEDAKNIYAMRMQILHGKASTSR